MSYKHKLLCIAHHKAREILIIHSAFLAHLRGQFSTRTVSELGYNVDLRRQAYDSAELRDSVGECGTKPVIPNRCNTLARNHLASVCLAAAQA
jgi:hypothetical protein